MKVIFIEDVPNIARAGQTREVANGYARNHLFPRKLAVLAASGAAAAVEAHIRKVVKKRAIEEAEMADLAKAIGGMEITITAKVGENDRLYGSVTGADIAGGLTKKVGREVDKRKVDLAEPIRQVGVYDVTLRFTHDITAVVVVTVMSDEPGAARPERLVKPPEVEKAEKAEKEEGEAKKEETKEKKPKKEKPPKKDKEVKAAELIAEVIEEKPTEKPGEEAAATAVKVEKPAREKKARAEKKEKPEKAEKPAEVESKGETPEKEEKKEKKARAKAKKPEIAGEDNKEG